MIPQRGMTKEAREPVGPTLCHVMHLRSKKGRVFDMFAFRYLQSGFLRYTHPDGWWYERTLTPYNVATLWAASKSGESGMAYLQNVCDWLAGEAEHKTRH